MVISQGEVWWADLTDPIGSEPGLRRPVLVIQGEALIQSRIATAICVPLTSNLKWGAAPGNVTLKAKTTGLPKDSVANVSQVVTIDKDMLAKLAGKVQRRQLEQVFAGLDLVLGR